MQTQRPDENVSDAIDYPFYISWELKYPDGNVARGVCLVATPEASRGVQQILSDEAKTAELRPIRLVNFVGSLRFCSEHGQQGSYKFCTECGLPTEVRDLGALTGQVVTERYCPKHGDLADNLFCHECGRRSLLHRIGVV